MPRWKLVADKTGELFGEIVGSAWARVAAEFFNAQSVGVEYYIGVKLGSRVPRRLGMVFLRVPCFGDGSERYGLQEATQRGSSAWALATTLGVPGHCRRRCRRFSDPTI